MGTGDDAGVYSLGDGRALIQTIDVFAPVVDSAEDWGRIAAANALSDVYAMGAEPLTALQYLAWPRDDLPFELASQVIEGGMDVMADAGCTVVGGHSIDGPEPHYGFALTGITHVGDILTNAGGSPDDVLLLTKPLGMGIVATAIKRDLCPSHLEEEAVRWMSQLNQQAGAAAAKVGASAVTDITGFGLLGHLREMCQASGVGAEIDFARVPVLDGVSELLAQGMWSGGSRRNLLALLSDVVSDRDDEEIKLLVDAQTSGGLLVAMSPAKVDQYVEMVDGAVAIGSLTSGNSLNVV
jgi:selenide,water dikinase